jgi:hypothetical protein
MTMPKAGTATELSEIQRAMGRIRHDMHEEVQGAVRGAQSLTDWRGMAASHPWAAIGLSAFVGYLVVPHRRSDRNPSDAHLAAALYAASHAPAASQSAGSNAVRPSIARSVFSILAPIAIRAAQNYALGQVEQWLAGNAFRFKEILEAGNAGPDQPPSSDQDVAGQTIRFRDRR